MDDLSDEHSSGEEYFSASYRILRQPAPLLPCPSTPGPANLLLCAHSGCYCQSTDGRLQAQSPAPRRLNRGDVGAVRHFQRRCTLLDRLRHRLRATTFFYFSFFTLAGLWGAEVLITDNRGDWKGFVPRAGRTVGDPRGAQRARTGGEGAGERAHKAPALPGEGQRLR